MVTDEIDTCISEEESDDDDDDIDFDPENEGSEYESSLDEDDASFDGNAGPNDTVEEVSLAA